MPVNEDLSLDMLGDHLKHAILSARERTGDPSITASIHEGLVHVSRGVTTAAPVGYDEGVAALQAMT